MERKLGEKYTEFIGDFHHIVRGDVLNVIGLIGDKLSIDEFTDEANKLREDRDSLIRGIAKAIIEMHVDPYQGIASEALLIYRTDKRYDKDFVEKFLEKTGLSKMTGNN